MYLPGEAQLCASRCGNKFVGVSDRAVGDLADDVIVQGACYFNGPAGLDIAFGLLCECVAAHSELTNDAGTTASRRNYVRMDGH